MEEVDFTEHPNEQPTIAPPNSENNSAHFLEEPKTGPTKKFYRSNYFLGGIIVLMVLGTAFVIYRSLHHKSKIPITQPLVLPPGAPQPDHLPPSPLPKN